MEHLAALTGLTSLAYKHDVKGTIQVDAIRAVGQLTRLRELKLLPPPACSDAHLQQLSTLTSLTSLELTGEGLRREPTCHKQVAVCISWQGPALGYKPHPARDTCKNACRACTFLQVLGIFQACPRQQEWSGIAA